MTVEAPATVTSDRQENSEVRTEGAERAPWRHWPVHRADVGRWAVAYVVLTLVMVGVGLLVVHVWDTQRLGTVDRDVAHWFADQRTPRWNDLGQIGAALADAYVLVPAIVVASVLFLVVFRRWKETLLLVAAILLEKAVFMTSTFIVDRERPPIGQLDGSPPTSSYPSGHVGAAVVFYVVCAIVVTWHFRSTIVRVLAWAIALIVPLLVALSRMLLGMHYLTDVVVGAALGAAAVGVGVFLVHHAVDDLDGQAHPEFETHGRGRGSRAVQWPATRSIGAR
jgi:undecaprenyl-diphosphatase